MKQILLITSLFLTCAVFAMAQKKPPVKDLQPQSPPGAATQQVSAPQVSENFIIGLEDVLAINVWKETELSVPTVVVRPDGKITLPLIGDVQASGLTTKKLQDAIAERLREYVATPTVTVTVTKVESQKVSIVGAVAKPGAYSLGSPMTVLDLIARAGGLTDYAKLKNIKIIRKRDGKTLAFNYKDVINGKNLSQNVVLENGDIVLVP
jgi:polysaccharide biosynthesis/export protein